MSNYGGLDLFPYDILILTNQSFRNQNPIWYGFFFLLVCGNYLVYNLLCTCICICVYVCIFFIWSADRDDPSACLPVDAEGDVFDTQDYHG